MKSSGQMSNLFNKMMISGRLDELYTSLFFVVFCLFVDFLQQCRCFLINRFWQKTNFGKCNICHKNLIPLQRFLVS